MDALGISKLLGKPAQGAFTPLVPRKGSLRVHRTAGTCIVGAPPARSTTRKDVELKWHCAVELFDAKAHAEAVAIFGQLPAQSKLLYNAAVLELLLGNQAAALRAVEQALTLDPFLAIAHQLHGNMLFASGRVQHALQAFQATHSNLRDSFEIRYHTTGLAACVRASDALYSQGICHARLGAYDSARDCFFLASERLLAHKSSAESVNSHVAPNAASQACDSHSAVADELILMAATRQRAGRPHLLLELLAAPLYDIFRPTSVRVHVESQRDYLGSSRVVRSVSVRDTPTVFSATRVASDKPVRSPFSCPATPTLSPTSPLAALPIIAQIPPRRSSHRSSRSDSSLQQIRLGTIVQPGSPYFGDSPTTPTRPR